jgi:hypothetical protein
MLYGLSLLACSNWKLNLSQNLCGTPLTRDEAIVRHLPEQDSINTTNWAYFHAASGGIHAHDS